MAEAVINAWQWLGRARTIDKEIGALLDAKQTARDALLRVTQNYSSDGVQSTKNPHKFDRLAELESLIDQRTDELVEVRGEIIATINRVQDGRQRAALLDYFVCLKTLEQTAVHLNYSYAHTKRLRAQGVDKIAALLKDEPQ